jgi:hypothetical protein
MSKRLNRSTQFDDDYLMAENIISKKYSLYVRFCVVTLVSVKSTDISVNKLQTRKSPEGRRSSIHEIMARQSASSIMS